MSKLRFLRGCGPLAFFIGGVIQGASFFMEGTSIWAHLGVLTSVLFFLFMGLLLA